MNKPAKHRCPACGFAIFNRRVAKCESCSAALPAELLFTPQQITAIDAEHERNEKIRQTFEHKGGTRGDSEGGDLDMDFDFGGGD